MSQESQFSEDSPIGWIQWFCGLQDHHFFCQVDEQYIMDSSNLFGLKKRINKYDQAIKMIVRHTAPQEDQIQNPKFLEVYQQATQLYGLIHARFIQTPLGLAAMRQKFLTGRFGHCPRVMCQKQNVLPIGLSQDLKIARVKTYCPRCKDVYSPKKKFADVDGAFFGTSFPQLLMMSFPDMSPCHKKENYEPTLFGFKIVEQQNPVNPEIRLQQKIQLKMQERNENNQVQQERTQVSQKKNKKKKR